MGQVDNVTRTVDEVAQTIESKPGEQTFEEEDSDLELYSQVKGDEFNRLFVELQSKLIDRLTTDASRERYESIELGEIVQPAALVSKRQIDDHYQGLITVEGSDYD